MRFLHTSDLHLGRKLQQLPLTLDAQHMLDQLAQAVATTGAQTLVVAGDVFDAPIPPESAVRAWDDFCVDMAARGVTMLVVGGNHDSGVRLAYGGRLGAAAGIHTVGELGDGVTSVSIDGVAFWLMPFVRPTDVRAWAAQHDIELPAQLSFDAAVRAVCDDIRHTSTFRDAGANVLISHQFVTSGSSSPERSDSERLSLGTLDNIDVTAFEGFDYVALGHVHRPQRVGRDTCRYAGSPLKYSTSEIDFAKSFVVVDVEPGNPASVSFELVPVVPLHEFCRVRGTFEQILDTAPAADDPASGDYVQVIVTDDEEPVDVAQRLRAVFPHLVSVEFDNARTNAAGAEAIRSIEEACEDLSQLFDTFFEAQQGRPMSDEERAIVNRALDLDPSSTQDEEVTA